MRTTNYKTLKEMTRKISTIMSKKACMTILLCIATVGLVACGSGSGPGRINNLPDITLPPSSQQPVETVGDQNARAPEIFSRSDSLIASTLYVETSNSEVPFLRVRATCIADECTFRNDNLRTITISKSDIVFTSASSDNIFSRNGITLLVAVDTDSSRTSWGAWMDHAAFQVEDTTMVEEGVRIDVRVASVLGDLSQSRPSTNVTWQGVLVGTPIDGLRKGNMLTGNARLTFDSAQQPRQIYSFLFARFCSVSEVVFPFVCDQGALVRRIFG